PSHCRCGPPRRWRNRPGSSEPSSDPLRVLAPLTPPAVVVGDGAELTVAGRGGARDDPVGALLAVALGSAIGHGRTVRGVGGLRVVELRSEERRLGQGG